MNITQYFGKNLEELEDYFVYEINKDSYYLIGKENYGLALIERSLKLDKKFYEYNEWVQNEEMRISGHDNYTKSELHDNVFLNNYSWYCPTSKYYYVLYCYTTVRKENQPDFITNILKRIKCH